MIKTAIYTLVFFAIAIAIGTLIGSGMMPEGQTFSFSAHYFRAVAELLAAVLTLTMGAAYLEKRQWNDGICKETGQAWRSFDTDSQGGRGYCSGSHTIWISWPVDDRKAA